MRSFPLLLGGTLAALCAGPLLATVPDLRGAFVASALVATAGLVLLWRADRLSLWSVLVGAIVLRLAYAPLFPVLSDDVFRYVWDGWIQASGFNPYRWRPAADALSAWHDTALFPRLNSAEYYSVYPPLSQWIFALGGWASESDWRVSYFAIKAVFMVLEGAGVWLLSRLTTIRNVMLYAWNPLVLLEVAGQAHTEAALLPFLLGAVWAVRHHAGVWASVGIAGAGLVKLYPFVLGPFLLRRFGWRAVWPGALVVCVVSLPYAAPYVLPNIKASVDLYATLFEFNAGLYYATKHMLWELTGTDWSKTLGPAFRVLFLAALPVLYAVDAWRDWPFQKAALWTLGTFFVLSTTVHPWYVLAVLPLAAMKRPPVWAWFWLAACALGTYTFYTGGLYWPWVVAGWGGAALFGLWRVGTSESVRRACDAVLQRVQCRRAARKANRLAPFLTPQKPSSGSSLRVLDLGAGEGYVGQVLQERYDAHVRLADVVDMNRTDLPLDLYDGRRLPYADGAFDVVVLYYVLHHCASPERVLQEALRVADTVLVVETVYHSALQRRLLHVLDPLANRVRSGGSMREQEEHLAFRTPDRWERTFADLGATLCDREQHGSWFHPQATWRLRAPEERSREAPSPVPSPGDAEGSTQRGS